MGNFFPRLGPRAEDILHGNAPQRLVDVSENLFLLAGQLGSLLEQRRQVHEGDRLGLLPARSLKIPEHHIFPPQPGALHAARLVLLGQAPQFLAPPLPGLQKLVVRTLEVRGPAAHPLQIDVILLLQGRVKRIPVMNRIRRATQGGEDLVAKVGFHVGGLGLRLDGPLALEVHGVEVEAGALALDRLQILAGRAFQKHVELEVLPLGFPFLRLFLVEVQLFQVFKNQIFFRLFLFF